MPEWLTGIAQLLCYWWNLKMPGLRSPMWACRHGSTCCWLPPFNSWIRPESPLQGTCGWLFLIDYLGGYMEMEEISNCPGQRGAHVLCSYPLWASQKVTSYCMLTVDYENSLLHSRSTRAVYDDSMGLQWWSPKHTWEDSERRADIAFLFHSVRLTVVSLLFHPHLFTRPAYRRYRCALVLVIPARPRFAISGSWLGGSGWIRCPWRSGFKPTHTSSLVALFQCRNTSTSHNPTSRVSNKRAKNEPKN